ncbi:hsp90 co-chaperone Cdc37-like [Schistocerca serialis cubense]|uniref:hsp90 co-chaperone Cdc37-like n=1 Tax=Schistocerca serialis cubense TaxID=2023355 RepID=UPI00214E4D05|nr:hsp90 co-chaperone Cdc37-like [Schistocerca serialis cubense]
MIYIAEGEDKKAFDNEPHSSIDEIHSTAAVKLKVALAEADEEELNVVAYSKWKDTEISDVEEDTHPYIDTSSLFRWRHQARIARMEEQRRCKKETEKEHESEHTANYLVIWCIHLEMEEKHDLMDHVSHLRICIQYIQERHKKSIFFASYVLPTKADNIAEGEDKKAFDNEPHSSIDEIHSTAAVKLKVALAEADEEEC